jgi:hypothetical protein
MRTQTITAETPKASVAPFTLLTPLAPFAPSTPFLGWVADRILMPAIAARNDAGPGTVWLFIYGMPFGAGVPVTASQLCGPLGLTEQAYAALAERKFPRERVADLARSAAAGKALAVFLWVCEPGLGIHTVSAAIRRPSPP